MVLRSFDPGSRFLVPLSLVFVTACGGARTVGPEWPSRIATVTVSGVEPTGAPDAARRFFEEVSVQMLGARGYRPAGAAEPDARLRVLLEDWEVDSLGTVRVQALFVLVSRSTGELLWSASRAATAEPMPAMRPQAELTARRPPWEVAAERAVQTALRELPRGRAGDGEGG